MMQLILNGFFFTWSLDPSISWSLKYREKHDPDQLEENIDSGEIL